MELNLNELERRAKSAGGQEWTLTIDATGDAFLSAENSEYVAEVGAVGEDGIVSDYGKFIAAANPAVVLELVRRLREAEARVAELEAERAELEKQERVAWLDASTYDRPGCMVWLQDDLKGMDTTNFAPLCAAPPVTAPVRLTDEQADTIWREIQDTSITSPEYPHRRFKDKIEAASLRANGFDIQPARGEG